VAGFQRVVRPDFVVAIEPFGRDLADLVERVGQVGAQHFLAVGPVEALDVGVLIGLARLDEAKLDVLVLAPIGERLARQFGAVVATNCAGPAV